MYTAWLIIYAFFFHNILLKIQISFAISCVLKVVVFSVSLYNKGIEAGGKQGNLGMFKIVIKSCDKHKFHFVVFLGGSPYTESVKKRLTERRE